MSLKVTLDAELKDAMRAKDSVRLDAIRMLKTAIKNKEIDKMKPLEEAEILTVIQTMVKQRRDSIEMFTKGGRPELAQKEQQEIDLLQKYLPQQLSGEAVAVRVREILAAQGLTNAKDMGKAMKVVMEQLRGQAEGNDVRQAVQKILGAG